MNDIGNGHDFYNLDISNKIETAVKKRPENNNMIELQGLPYDSKSPLSTNEVYNYTKVFCNKVPNFCAGFWVLVALHIQTGIVSGYISSLELLLQEKGITYHMILLKNFTH